MNDSSIVLDFLTHVGSEPVIWLSQIATVILASLTLHFGLQKLLGTYLDIHITRKNIWKHALVQSLLVPLLWCIWFYGGLVIIDIINIKIGFPSIQLVGRIKDVGLIIMTAWFLNRFISIAENNLSNPQFGNHAIDQSSLDLTSKSLRILLWVISGLILIEALGYSITGVLALGGVGGLAIGFASKDLFANFFGGIMIFLDRPFSLGDWIRSPDRQIEGVVEKIGWRSTRVMTFDQRPIYIPNAVFAQIIVENPSRMLNRRILETIGIRYQDLSKMTSIVAEIKKLLLSHPEIEQQKSLTVNFNEFSDSSLDIRIDGYVKAIDAVRFHEIKQEILLGIASIVYAKGADFAFPSTTVYSPPPVSSEDNR